MGAMELDDFPTGELMRLSPLVGRVLAPNPSPFTYTGTQTYVVGQAELAVIDPGPDHPSHLEALLRVVAGRAVDEGAGAVQNLDRLGEFGRHKLARGDAVQAAEADIIARQGKAANDEQFARDAKAQRGADRRVVFQHLAQRLRLLVKDQRQIGRAHV